MLDLLLHLLNNLPHHYIIYLSCQISTKDRGYNCVCKQKRVVIKRKISSLDETRPTYRKPMNKLVSMHINHTLRYAISKKRFLNKASLFWKTWRVNRCLLFKTPLLAFLYLKSTPSSGWNLLIFSFPFISRRSPFITCILFLSTHYFTYFSNSNNNKKTIPK